MKNIEIEKLKNVDLRDLWKHEAYDFSKWVVDNLDQLSEELDLSLTEPEIEKNVDNFRCDIYCREENSNAKVIIENQLEISNHEHLGKIITYASGLDASIIIWIVKEARNEHISAISWLNKISDDNIWFFLIEVHAYQIGNSNPAVKFEIIEKPNEYEKILKNSLPKKDSLLNLKQYDFWNQFNKYLVESKSSFRPRNAYPKGFYSLNIGSSKCVLGIWLAETKGTAEVMLYIKNDKELYDNLEKKKEQIVASLSDYELTWLRLDDKKASRISTIIEGLNLTEGKNNEEIIRKIVIALEKFKYTFSKLI